MEHDWGSDPQQCRRCGGTDPKQRCVPRPAGKKAGDARRCIGCPAADPDFVILPSGKLALVCVECAQAKSYWVCKGEPTDWGMTGPADDAMQDATQDPIELHPTLELAVAGADGIIRRGHLRPVFVWDVVTAAVVARSLGDAHVELARRLGLELGFDDDDPDRHQYRHLAWRGFGGRALCKSRRLWFQTAVGETDRPVLDCEECLGQFAMIFGLFAVSAPGWVHVELGDALERLAAQHVELFEVFSAASDLVWAIENPEDAKAVPNCEPAAMRARLLAALNRVPAPPTSPTRQRWLERNLSDLVEALPRCEQCKGARKLATHRSLDAASNCYTCAEHSGPGATPLLWSPAVTRAKLLLEGT